MVSRLPLRATRLFHINNVLAADSSFPHHCAEHISFHHSAATPLTSGYCVLTTTTNKNGGFAAFRNYSLFILHYSFAPSAAPFPRPGTAHDRARLSREARGTDASLTTRFFLIRPGQTRSGLTVPPRRQAPLSRRAMNLIRYGFFRLSCSTGTDEIRCLCPFPLNPPLLSHRSSILVPRSSILAPRSSLLDPRSSILAPTGYCVLNTDYLYK